MGINDALQGKTKSQSSEFDKWKSMLGTSLGELGGSLVNWYKFPTSESYPKHISELLLNLQNDIKTAPSGTSTELLTNLRKLSALGNKTSFNEAERDQVAAALRDVLYSTLSFAGIENSPALPSSNSSISPAQQSEQYLEKGKNAAVKGDYNNAVANYNSAIKLNPANGILYYHRAKALEELGRIDEAISDYNLMIAFKTDLRKAYYNRGTLYLEKKNYILAIEDLDKSLAIDPKYTNAYINRANCYYSLNKHEKAIADYSQALMLDANQKDIYETRAYSYCQIGKTALALKDQEQAIKLGAKITKGCPK
ncbi:MAG: tetratricopeptide repeat protein [Pyrinomonadaceae bacterium]|nr:tetratricopeptide repeat protein [Pyrinomonadaceae bacterium]